MKHYAFTVTRHSDDYTQIEDITYQSYNPFWQLLEDMSLIIIYKVEHLGGNSNHCNHKHYHGVIYGNINYQEITDKTKNKYSVKFEDLNEPQRWHHYCLHEINDEVVRLKEKQDLLKGTILLDKIMQIERPVQQKIKPLLKIQFFTNI